MSRAGRKEKMWRASVLGSRKTPAVEVMSEASDWICFFILHALPPASSFGDGAPPPPLPPLLLGL
jgi:hypothetical protein